MAEKQVDITGRYSMEIQDIANKLRQLESNRIYELSGAQMDGYLTTNIQQLKKMIAQLIAKVEYGKGSVTDELSDIFDKIEI
jgi:hypothetical protein